MAELSDEAAGGGGCCGCAIGAVLGLLLGSLLTGTIVKANNPTMQKPENRTGGGPTSIYYPLLPGQIVEGAYFGGLLGLILGSIGGWLLGRKMATKPADRRKAAEDGRKGILHDNRAETSITADRPRKDGASSDNIKPA